MRAAVLAGCDPLPLLEPGKEVLDLVALAVECFVVWIGHFSAAARWTAALYTLCPQGFAEGLPVVATVGNQRFGCGRLLSRR